MDCNVADQSEHFCRFFGLYEQPKKTIRSIANEDQIALVTLEEAVESLVDVVPQVQEMVKLVKGNCQQPVDDLSIDESASIMLYTLEWEPKENSFYSIFHRKFSSESENSNELQPWHFYYKLFSTSLSKLPRSSRRILYRGTQSNLHSQFSKNQRFAWHAYSSCSSSINSFTQAEISSDQANGRTLFVIHSEYGIDIGNHSFYPTKQEILLPSNLQFRVVSSRASDEGLCLIIVRDSPIESILATRITAQEKETFDLLFQKRAKKYEKYAEINLRGQNLTDDHLDIIVSYAIRKKKCSWLSLQNNQITSHGLSILATGLEGNQSLQSLHLSVNLIMDSGVECLAMTLGNRHSYLTFLSLSYNRITDEGARYLADMLKRNDSLTDLWLSYNQIGNDGLQALAEVLTFSNTTLIQFYVDGNTAIDDASVYSLVQMLKANQRLNTVWLQDCSLTQKGKAKLETTVHGWKDFDLNV